MIETAVATVVDRAAHARVLPRDPEPRERRCIIVAPFFPPSGLPPSHRARLFARHLGAFGWTPVVVTVDPRDREEPQEAPLEATVPGTVRVEKVRALRASLTRRFGIGDLALRALPALATRVIHVARERTGSVVLLVVPPWYVLWLAPLIRRFGNSHIVVDYVDPWRIGGRSIKSRLAAWVAARTEGFSIRRVAGVFAVSDGVLTDVRTRFPWLQHVASGWAAYGFEPSDLGLVGAGDSAGESPSRTRSAGDAQSCRLVYVGALSDSQLPVLEALLDAIAELRQQLPALAQRLRLELYGTTYAAPQLARARATELVTARGLEALVHEQPQRVPYTDALALARQADANLVLGDLTTYYAASKLMPLLAARRPILALLHAGTEPATALSRLGAKGLVCYGTPMCPSPRAAVSAVVQALRALLDRQIRPVTPDFASDPVFRERTAERMTAALAALLDRVGESSAGAGICVA